MHWKNWGVKLGKYKSLDILESVSWLTIILWTYAYFIWKAKKCRKAEYVQRRVRFVNLQVPCPHSIIYVKFCTSRLCMKMSSFLFVRAWGMPRILYLPCGDPFPVWTPDNISGLISVVLWLSRWEVMKKKSGNILFKWGGGGKIIF